MGRLRCHQSLWSVQLAGRVGGARHLRGPARPPPGTGGRSSRPLTPPPGYHLRDGRRRLPDRTRGSSGPATQRPARLAPAGRCRPATGGRPGGGDPLGPPGPGDRRAPGRRAFPTSTSPTSSETAGRASASPGCRPSASRSGRPRSGPSSRTCGRSPPAPPGYDATACPSAASSTSPSCGATRRWPASPPAASPRRRTTTEPPSGVALLEALAGSGRHALHSRHAGDAGLTPGPGQETCFGPPRSGAPGLRAPFSRASRDSVNRGRTA